MYHHRKSLVPAIDTPVALALALLAGVYAARAGMPVEHVRTFLAMRITLLNAGFLIALALIWTRAVEFSGLGHSGTMTLGKAIFRALRSCFLATVAVAIFLTLRHGTQPTTAVAVNFFFASSAYFLLRLLGTHLRSSSLHAKRRVVILGTGRRASRAWRELRVNRSAHTEVVGFIDDRNPADMPPDFASRWLTDSAGMPEYLLHNVVDELIIAVPMKSCYDMAQRSISIAESVGIQVSCLQDIYTLSPSRHRHKDMFHELSPTDNRYRIAQGVKRLVDLTIASMMLVLLSPVFLIVGLLVKLTSAGPVFFAQERYGYHRRIFKMYKFRSMVKDAPNMMASVEAQNEAVGPIFKVANDPRITRLGKFIRKTSLDELPQLLNVILGDMSLVGPRPMTTRDVSKFYDAALMRRFSVRPGMTGSWQVMSRGTPRFDEWVRLDFGYIESWSLGLDFKLLAMTVPALLKRSGAA